MLGIGTDIVEIARIERLTAKYDDKFAARVLHPNELQQWQSLEQSTAFLAKRFAAKEAVGKALGTGLGEGVAAADIEIVNGANGKPTVQLHRAALTQFEALGGQQCLVSISDEKAYAVAFATIS